MWEIILKNRWLKQQKFARVIRHLLRPDDSISFRLFVAGQHFLYNKAILNHSTYFFYKRVSAWLEENEISSIVDVGGNEGWLWDVFSHFINRDNLSGFIFEPIPRLARLLQQKLYMHKQIKIYNMAVGEKSGKITLHEYADSGLSSVLEIQGESYADFSTNVVSSHQVKLVTLDSMLPGKKKYLLKIDVQGYELAVLKGAKKLIESGCIKGIIVEVMTKKHYHKQVLYTEIFDYLHANGYVLHDLLPSYYEGHFLVDFDCFFVKE